MENKVHKQINNPEALLDVLAMQSLRQRQGGQQQVSFSMTSDIDALVQSFTIDDSIAECFAPNKYTKGRKTKKGFTKEKENPVKNYGKKSPWKVSNNTLSTIAGYSGPKKLLSGGVFQRKTKKADNSRTVPTSESYVTQLTTAETSPLQISARKNPFKLNSSTTLCPDAITFTQNKSAPNLNAIAHVASELSPIIQMTIASREFEPITTSGNGDSGFVVCDVTSKSSEPVNETVMDCLKQAIKLDNERQLKIILSEICPSSHVTVNEMLELVSMATHMGQDSCLLTLLEYLSSATNVTSRDKQTIARAAALEAVRTDHVTCLQSLVAKGYTFWEDEHPSLLEESKKWGSVVCYHYLLLLQVLALTLGTCTGSESLKDILKSIHKQCDSSDCDINNVILNVLQHHGFIISKTQTTASKPNISVEEDYVSLSQCNRTGNAEEEECICTCNPCVCGKHETRMKSHLGYTGDKISRCPPSSAVKPKLEDSMVEKIQCADIFISQGEITPVSEKSKLSVPYLAADSNNNLPHSKIGSLTYLNTTFLDQSEGLCNESLATGLNNIVVKPSERFSNQTYLNKTVTDQSESLTKQSMATGLNKTMAKTPEELSNQSSAHCLATYLNMPPPQTDGLSNQCTTKTRKCDGETISTSIQPLRQSQPANESPKERGDRDINRHSPELLEIGDDASKPQQNSDKDYHVSKPQQNDDKYCNVSKPEQHRYNDSQVYKPQQNNDKKFHVSKPQHADKNEGNYSKTHTMRNTSDKLSTIPSECSVVAEFLPSSNTSNRSCLSESQSLLITGKSSIDSQSNGSCWSESQSTILSQGSVIGELLLSSNTSNGSCWSESQSLLITGKSSIDTSDSQSFPTISEWCSSASNVTSYCSDDEESSYYSEDDVAYNTVILNLQDEELDPEQLSEERLRKHLESTRRQIYHYSDYVETVVTADGQRLSEHGEIVAASSSEEELGESKNNSFRGEQDKRLLLTSQSPSCRYSKDRGAPKIEDRSKNRRSANPEVGVHSLADDTFKESMSPGHGQNSVEVHRDRHFLDTENAEWNCRPWYEVSDDDSLCLNRSNDSDSDVITW